MHYIISDIYNHNIVFADMIPSAVPIEESSCISMKVEQDEHSNHDGSQGSPLPDDDDAASDGVTDKSSLDDDKKDGSGKKRKRRVRVNIKVYLLFAEKVLFNNHSL